jgi:hypothetical protein
MKVVQINGHSSGGQQHPRGCRRKTYLPTDMLFRFYEIEVQDNRADQ